MVVKNGMIHSDTVQNAEQRFLMNGRNFIRHTVNSFLNYRACTKEGQDIAEDMIQEAFVSVLQKFRRRGSNENDNILCYHGVILDACKRVLNQSNSIITPFYWLQTNGAKGKKARRTWQFEPLFADTLTAAPFEEATLNKIIISNLLEQVPSHVKRIFALISYGFTPYEVQQKLNIDHKTVRHWLSKAKNILEQEMMTYTKSSRLAS